MPGFDKILYATLERLLSSDMNTDARVRSRGLMEILRQTFATTQLNNNNTAAVTEFTKNLVLGGLKVIPGAGGVSVTPGMITQYWAGAGASPSSDESTYVFGELRAQADIAIAVPGVDTWYLVQARCTTVTTNQTRDIWNPGTETFDSTVVAQFLENTIEFNVKTGTTANLPLPDAGWTMLAGVKRLAVGTDPTAANIVDLRPLYDRNSLNVQTRGCTWKDVNLTTSHFDAYAATAGNGVFFNLQHKDDLGWVFARTTASAFVDVTAAPFVDPATVLAADTWYYLYMAYWAADGEHGCAPRGCYSNVVNQGLLVLSHVPPTSQGSDGMPSGVSYPAPFSLDTSRVGVCVGMLLRNPANDGWVAEQIIGNRAELFSIGVSSLEAQGASPITLGAGRVPLNARTITMRAGISTGGLSFLDFIMGSQTMRRLQVQTLGNQNLIELPATKTTPATMVIQSGNPGQTIFSIVQALEF